MTRKQKKRYLLGALAVALIATVTFLLPRLWQTDFRTALAKVLSEDARHLVLNVPPAEGLLPGSVFLKDRQRLIPVKRTPRAEPSITQGESFELGWSQMADAEGKSSLGGGALGALFGDTESAKIEVRAVNCRVLDMDVAEITRRVKTGEVMDLAADATKQVAVIVRAYEGILETKLRRTSKATAEAWKELQEKAKTAGSANATAGKTTVEIKGSSDSEVVVAWKQPVVFACVVQRVSYFATHLGTQADGVKLEEVLEGENLVLEPRLHPTGAPSAQVVPEKPWALLTMASGYYPKNTLLRQDWNAASAEVFEASLQPWQPVMTKRLWATPAQPLQRDALLAEVRDFFP